MSRFRSLPHRRAILFALALGAVVALLVLAAPQRAAAIICGPDSYPSRNVIYYSGPKHEKQVGEYYGCTGDLTGEETNYYTSLPVCCPGD